MPGFTHMSEILAGMSGVAVEYSYGLSSSNRIAWVCSCGSGKKLTELKGEIDKSTNIMEDFSCYLLVTNIIRLTIRKDIDNLNNTINKLFLKYIYRALNQQL